MKVPLRCHGCGDVAEVDLSPSAMLKSRQKAVAFRCPSCARMTTATVDPGRLLAGRVKRRNRDTRAATLAKSRPIVIDGVRHESLRAAMSATGDSGLVWHRLRPWLCPKCGGWAAEYDSESCKVVCGNGHARKLGG